MTNILLEKGAVINNQRLCEIFKCSTQGGMRRSKKTNSLVLISNNSIDLFKNTWEGNVLHYCGMGLDGDQDINYMQNKTLSESDINGVSLHLFEVYIPQSYIYVGRVKLHSIPYTKIVIDKNIKRKIWVFPLIEANHL